MILGARCKEKCAGIDTRQLSSPDVYIPYTCRQIVVDREWNATNRLSNLSQIVNSSNTNYYPEVVQKGERHPVCVPHVDLVDEIKRDGALVALFEGLSRAQMEATQLQTEVAGLKGAYRPRGLRP